MGMVGVIAYLIEMYIRPQDWMACMYAFPLVDIIAFVALVMVVFSLIQQHRPIALPQVYFILLFLVMVFLSNIFNGYSSDALNQLVIYAKRAAVFFMFLFLIKSTGQLKAVINIIIMLTVLLAIQSIYQSKTGIGLAGQSLKELYGFGGGRASWVGAWDGPNVLCLLFVIAIALSLEFTGRPYGAFHRLINLIFIIVMLWGVFVTNSRGGFLGLLAVVFTFLWVKLIRNKRFIIKLVILILSTTFILAAMKFGPSRISELNTKEQSAHVRSWLWESGINNLRENPIFGVGKGHFSVAGHTAAHNNFVQNMAEMGFPGLLIYISLIYLSLKGLYIIIKNRTYEKSNPILVSLSRGLFVSMIGYAITTFFVTMELDILFAWFGLCAVAINIAQSEIKDLRLRFSLMDAGIVFSGALGVLFVLYLIALKEII